MAGLGEAAVNGEDGGHHSHEPVSGRFQKWENVFQCQKETNQILIFKPLLFSL